MKKYIDWDPKEGYPAGPAIFYECLRCGQAIPSTPSEQEPWECACGNIDVDPPQGRAGADDDTKVRIFEDHLRLRS